MHRIAFSGRIVRTLDPIAAWRGYPKRLLSDSDPELISQQLKSWSEINGVQLDFIKQGKPAQNGYIERFDREYREDVLDYYIYSSLAEVRQITELCVEEYNALRPYSSLNSLPFYQFAAVNARR